MDLLVKIDLGLADERMQKKLKEKEEKAVIPSKKPV
ncbi:hypothetical protein HE1_00900 [Holospora elegans E1]|uniref:Uncharacterized protein n=1 Tax=Holospora elegans E1 TaxID=1427503 RepID=A0A023DZS5_9PROT|nr:hypothetical protein HE1_00900 [Holospora elegans E1]